MCMRGFWRAASRASDASAHKSCARRGFCAAGQGGNGMAARAPCTLWGGCIIQPPAPLSRAPACHQAARRSGSGAFAAQARAAGGRAGAPPGEAQVVVGVHKHLHVEAAAERLHVQDQDALRAVVSPAHVRSHGGGLVCRGPLAPGCASRACGTAQRSSARREG